MSVPPASSHHPHAPVVPRPLHRVLVANRGEIACRVLRTCRAMGLGTVAVYSDADAHAPHLELADVAVRLGPAPARDSYLSIPALLAAAAATGADAVHPGYGFLSENATFARAVAEAGLTFIGPSPMVIQLLGSKREAKLRAEAARVPTVPGYSGEDQEVATLARAAGDIGFPLLVKASAGGGGKGMRIVRRADELVRAIEAAKREALGAFADDTLILERYVERPRHVEIQILGDHHGTLVHLWERECSIQRRHQKVIEEAPSPALTPELRAAMGAAGVAVGKAVGYTSAGTVEFILGADGAFYFLEVNTRLQVEHPVTEATTGLDLVREQLRIARGERLGYDQAPPQRGHAIEVRLYAEDPAAGWLPTTGTVAAFELPTVPGPATELGPHLRVDSGVRAGTEVGIHYDPMLAKVIAHAPTRGDAAALLAWALERATLAGVTTNRDMLARTLRHPAFLAGELDTHFLERHPEVVAAAVPPATLVRAALGATAWLFERGRRGPRPLPHVEPGWRNVWHAPEHVRWRAGDEVVAVAYRNLGQGALRCTVGATTHELRVLAADEGGVRWQDGDLAFGARVVPVGGAAGGDPTAVHVAGQGWAVDLALEPRFPEQKSEVAPGSLVAPMPGKVVKVQVAVGDAVPAGATLLILEAMKMEQPVRAPVAGTVTALAVALGEQVEADQLLAVVRAD
ncbi:MAG: ATP-grasp domain-containing protein [Kofleriaceae bacterium]|nr:ATP-grasp domain-containing protein [Kofleriaceae bacterium]MCL4223410.1 ATP-grasp domain-containing protein [Myxococcales bacterium]